MILFVTALNTNTAFAREISEIPVLGAVARIFTFRSYVEESDELKVSVEIPSLEMISEETNGLADSVNQEIHTLCEQYADEAVKRAEEYKKAFMETGGTQEEWEAHNIEIRVFYEIKSQTEDFLSFAVSGTENWTSAYSETRYYNIDLKNEKLVTLEDILGAGTAHQSQQLIDCKGHDGYIQHVGDPNQHQISPHILQHRNDRIHSLLLSCTNSCHR